MKKLFSFLLIPAMLLSVSTVIAQDCEIYKDYKEGTSTKMVHYDKKDKVTGYTISTVKEKKEIPGGVSLLFHQAYDDTKEVIFETEFDVRCENGNVKVDMNKMLDPTTMTGYEDMELDVTADDLTIPSNASPGDKLDDGSVSVTVNTGSPVKVTITVTLSNRKVESREKVETPAGNFDCLKITYDMLTEVGFIKMRSSAAEYYSRNHGVVRSESFNKNGKLTGYSLVEEISK